ncbi:glycosyltransferase involved in cell wall biosynthesis [Conyzicola nivalis]|uniref:Glycosyltransferase involved in cell wall biosynthesis n=1 Tax=Conyzicola nivalis TaxID=1477021 RepID=A0ABV2QPC4_9MICO
MNDGRVSGGPVNAAAARVDVVFPCLNEEGALPWILGRLPRGYRAIVVDNGSTDRSAEVAREHGALVVTEPRRGFGSAAHAGLLAATAPIVAFCDADASMDPRDLPRVVDPVASGAADLVLGRRRPTSRGAWPLHARVANRALASLMRGATKLPLHDLGPMRAVRREAMIALDLEDRRSGYPLELVLRGHEEGWRILEVDSPYSPRIGRSKVTGTIRGTYIAVLDMSRLLRAQRR